MLLVAYCSFLLCVPKLVHNKGRLFFRIVQAGKLLFIFCNVHYIFSVLIQSVVSFFCVWNRFFLSASLRHLPVPLVRAFAIPQGRVFAGCEAAERIARGNRASPVFSSCPTGLRLKISCLRFLATIILKLCLKSYLCKSEI